MNAEPIVGELWTSKQRQGHSLHEISYRACFKPQLPRYFIDRYSLEGDVVYDPFMGRGTTLLEAALAGRAAWGCDINPLSKMLLRPRFSPPSLEAIAERLDAIDLVFRKDIPEELLVFYHPETLNQLCALRDHFLARESDAIDDWIRMVAINRLTGHSDGFFSVYTLPPNQATSVKAQTRINAKRNQTPPARDIKAIILKKSKSLLRDYETGSLSDINLLLITALADETPTIPDGSVTLVVTSPPFLDIVDYAGDNWLRSWFAGIDPESVSITMAKKPEKWALAMTKVFHELVRVLKRGGHIAFEVGEVRKGTINLEDLLLPVAAEVGLETVAVLINDQEFTKTSNCWGVDNRSKGTNTNRILLLRKG